MKTILVIGQQYNDWKAVKFDGVDEKRRRRYLCRCKCGEEKSMVASSVFAGRTRMCRKCKALDLTDRQFFDWTVIERRGSDKHQKSVWLCRCRCGKEEEVSGGNLKKGSSRRCFDCGHNVFRGETTIPASWWIKQVGQAKIRGIEWSLSEEEALKQFLRQDGKCALTGMDLTFSPRTASIDRIDSDKSYCASNIHWVHKHINMMKYKYDLDYFVKLCKMVAENCFVHGGT